MRKAKIETALTKMRGILTKCEAVAAGMESAADDYEAEVENPSDDATARLDAYREAASYLESGMLNDAIDTLESAI